MVRLHGNIGSGLASVLIATLPLFPHAAWSSQNPQPATVPVEVIALDRDGTFADNLTPGSFAVAVDGRPRQASAGPVDPTCEPWARLAGRRRAAAVERHRRAPLCRRAYAQHARCGRRDVD